MTLWPASLLLISLAALLIAWVLVVRAVWRAPSGLQTHTVTTEDGWTLQVRRLPSPARRFKEPVVLCHGLANNHRFFDLNGDASLARVLSRAGFDCELVDLRGADGLARRPKGRARDASVDDHVAFDVPALVRAACARSGSNAAFWVGHSMGGLVALAAAQTPGLPLAGLVAIGSPLAFSHGRAARTLLGLATPAAAFGWLRADWAMLLITPLAGWFRFRPADGMVNHANVQPKVQRRAMANVFAPIWKSVLRQLHDWEAHDAFRSRGGVDWKAGLAALRVPTLLLGGSSDLLAAPRALTAGLPLLGSADKSMHVFGRAHGHLEDYGHGDLLIGDRAAAEVFPVLLAWLIARATPVEPVTGPAP